MKILITAEMDEKEIKELHDFSEITIAGWSKELRKLNENEMISLLKDKDILVTSYDSITKKVIDACESLRLIICTRANPVNIDTAAARERNIPVIYTPERNSDTTAEFTIALMLSIARKIPMIHKALKEGKFLRAEKEKNHIKKGLREDVTWALDSDSPYVLFKGNQLKNKTLGVIGYGSIGRRVVNIARAFGMKILIYDPFVSEAEINDEIQQKEDFEYVLKNSDFITVHCKVIDDTRGLIDKRAFDMMKKSAYFINTSRGAIVNEGALIEALRNEKIAGAALDVFESEPLCSNHPFITELDNVVITAHLGGATWDVLTNHTKMFVAEIKRFINKEPLLNEYK